MKKPAQKNSPNPVEILNPARLSAPHDGLPTLTRLENQTRPRHTGRDGISRISLMDAIEERFAQIFSTDREDSPPPVSCGDEALLREREI